MSFPVRCFTCGKVLSDKKNIYLEETGKGIAPSVIFEKLNITRYCCKRMFLGFVDVEEKLLMYVKCKE